MSSPIIRYCWCGFALRITGHWTGDAYVLVLSAATDDPDEVGPPLDVCPRCHTRLAVADLREAAPYLPYLPLQREADAGTALPGHAR